MAEAAKKRLRKDFKNLQVYSKVGMQFLFFILHIANPQILALILQSQNPEISVVC